MSECVNERVIPCDVMVCIDEEREELLSRPADTVIKKFAPAVQQRKKAGIFSETPRGYI